MSIRLLEQARARAGDPAILASDGRFRYGDLLEASASAASVLLDGAPDLKECRVAFLVPPNASYVSVQWGIWRAGGLAVPLCGSHPPPELDYVLADSGASIVVAHPRFEPVLRPLAEARKLRYLSSPVLLGAARAALPDVAPDRRALMLYTSGTTGKPKGVVTTHANIEAQTASLIAAWEWTHRDRILSMLPLHHIHGVINILTCCFRAGGVCEMMEAFDTRAVWDRIAGGRLTLFMAVPTIYAKLIAAWEAAGTEDRARMSAGCRTLRLMVSGSAALPATVLETWKAISGHFLLERYGMTEIGMALSNPLRGERQAGFVGAPLPGVDVRLADERGAPVPEGAPGEIQVRGPTVFLEYWRKPDATAGAFRDGWFCTGDTAVAEAGRYRILGRTSLDIIKTGGYKVSALEIEEVLRTHPAIADCAVVGVADPIWGERVCAALVLRNGRALALPELRTWAKQFLAPYKVPAALLALEELPRNAMGKVTKKAVAARFAPGGRPS